MADKNSGMARIGMVNFINTAPLYEVWKRTVNRPDWQVIEGPPAVLNRMLFNDELDLGFISSHEYASHPEKYKILSDLSISATGKVGSVLLFSECDFKELTGKKVLLSSQSQTSAGLVRIVLEEFYRVRPEYLIGPALQPDTSAGHIAAVLVIGDEALRLANGAPYRYRLDLAEVWRQHTGLPFVFAVWGVREAFCRSDPEAVAAIHQELRRCLDEGRRDLAAISRQVAPRIPLEAADCYRYLQGLEYDLDRKKQDALAGFFGYLIKKGEVPTRALPLKICG